MIECKKVVIRIDIAFKNKPTNLATKKTLDPKDRRIKISTWKTAKSSNTRHARTKQYQKYVAQGMEEAEAKEKTNWKTTPDDKMQYFDSNDTFLWRYHTLECNNGRQKIMDDMWCGHPIRDKTIGGWPNTSLNWKVCLKTFVYINHFTTSLSY